MVPPEPQESSFLSSDQLAEELAIVRACQQGALDEFAKLYDRYVTPIYRFAYYRTFDKMLAEDLTSTTFLKALEKIKSFDASRGNFGAWLYRIARNTVTDHFRSHRPTASLVDEDEGPMDLPGDDDASKEAAQGIGLSAIRKELATLDPLKRDIVLLRLWDGLSYREIADIVGKSEGNCKVIFCRTLDDLRTKLSVSLLLILLLYPFLSHP